MRSSRKTGKNLKHGIVNAKRARGGFEGNEKKIFLATIIHQPTHYKKKKTKSLII